MTQDAATALNLPPMDILVPQRGHMRLIGAVDAYGPASIDARTIVNDAWPFVRNGQMRAVVSFELMTQSVAAFLMLINLKTGQPPPKRIPVVTRIHTITLHRDTLPVGTELLAHAALERGDGETGIFCAKVRDSAGPVAEARFTVTRVPHEA